MDDEIKSGWEQWMGSDFREDIRRLRQWLRVKRAAILVTFVWGIAVGLVVFGEYYLLYSTVLWDREYIPLYVPLLSKMHPRLSQTSYFILLGMSLLAGFALADIEDTLFSSITSIILTLAIGTIFSTLYMWYGLEVQTVLDLSYIPYVMWAGFLNVFSMIFPLAVLVAFIGSIFGCLIRDFVRPIKYDYKTS